MDIMMVSKNVLEIALLTVTFYYIILFIKGTPVVPVLKVLVIFLVVFFAAQKLQLYTINWVLSKIFAILVIALLIIFQPELRRALVHLGEVPFLGFAVASKQNLIDEITEAVMGLARKKIGALVVFEREIGLKHYIETGVKIDGVVSGSLLKTIFMPNTILHDGAVIIQRDKVAAAGCILPLSQNSPSDRSMGTRHQAALGLTEETDAMVFVISEETGIVSIAYKGKFSRGLDESGIRKILANVYTMPKKGAQ